MGIKKKTVLVSLSLLTFLGAMVAGFMMSAIEKPYIVMTAPVEQQGQGAGEMSGRSIL